MRVCCSTIRTNSTVLSWVPNYAEGVAPCSPGLPRSGYPGVTVTSKMDPNGVPPLFNPLRGWCWRGSVPQGGTSRLRRFVYPGLCCCTPSAYVRSRRAWSRHETCRDGACRCTTGQQVGPCHPRGMQSRVAWASIADSRGTQPPLHGSRVNDVGICSLPVTRRTTLRHSTTAPASISDRLQSVRRA